MDDRQLLARYVTEASDDAFRELVHRHMGLVYSAALRQMNDLQLAQDVTQMVFANLARKARSIPAGTILAGWLHRDTRFTALDLLRAEVRRSKREQQAAAMNALESLPDHNWEQMRPLLDEALDELGAADRDALLLRYFEQRDFNDVGEALGASSEAARKRVDRALDRLREFLIKRGITTSSAALGAALSAHAIETVPTVFASALTAGSAAAVAVAEATWLSNLMLMTKSKLALSSALFVAALATPLIVQQQSLASARANRLTLEEQAHAASAVPDAPAAPALEIDFAARRDRDDLERLRGELAALRERLSQLAAQEKTALAARDTRKPAEPARFQVVGIADARNVGQSTPANLVQTFVWALSNNDTNTVLQLVANDTEPDLQKLIQRAFAALKRELVGTVTSYGCTAFQVQGDRPAENDDRWLAIDLMTPNGPLGQTSDFRIRQSPAGWRLVITADGMPINDNR